MALEQVVPVVPHGTFSVTTRKASWALPFPPQWSCGDKEGGLRAHAPEEAGPAAGGCGAWGGRTRYLQQRVLAGPVEAVALPVEGEVVAVPVHGAGARAGLLRALPLPALAGAVGGGGCQAPAGSAGPSRRGLAPPAAPDGPAHVPGVAADADGLAGAVVGLVVHAGAVVRRHTAALPVGHQPGGAHAAGHALGAVLWAGRTRSGDRDGAETRPGGRRVPRGPQTLRGAPPGTSLGGGLRRGPGPSRGGVTGGPGRGGQGHSHSPRPGCGSSSGSRRPRPRAWRCGSPRTPWAGHRLRGRRALRGPPTALHPCFPPA